VGLGRAVIVGLLPMGGKGTRLGSLTPKPLMPTITSWGIVPLYQHALGRLQAIAETVYSLVHADSCSCIRKVDLPTLETNELELPGALADAATTIRLVHGPDTLIALAFPDSIWAMEGDLTAIVAAVRGDGAVGLFDAAADELDTVVLDGPKVREIVTKQAGAAGIVRGWGSFIVRADALEKFTAHEKDGPQLGRLDLGWAYLGEYADLGTPERYIRHHDQRERHDLQPARAGLAQGSAA
jgi:hypothetical protein